MIIKREEFDILKPSGEGGGQKGKTKQAPPGVLPWPPPNGTDPNEEEEDEEDDQNDDNQNDDGGEQDGGEQDGDEQDGDEQDGDDKDGKKGGNKGTKQVAKQAGKGAAMKGFGEQTGSSKKQIGDVLDEGSLKDIIAEAEGEDRNNTKYGPRETFTKGDDLQEGDIEAKIKKIAKKSMRTAGTGSAGLDRTIRKLLKPKVDWRAELQDFVAEIGQQYDSKVNRESFRKYASNTDSRLLPGREDELLPNTFNSVVVCVDTSGSIGEDELALFGAEIKSICSQQTDINDLYIVYCDWDIPKDGIQRFDTNEDFEIEYMAPKGGGGTSFYPPFKWISEYDKSDDNTGESGFINPAFVVYFTDAEGDSPPIGDPSLTTGDGDDYSERVIWIVIDHTEDDAVVKNLKFGKTICISREEI